MSALEELYPDIARRLRELPSHDLWEQLKSAQRSAHSDRAATQILIALMERELESRPDPF